MLQIAHLLSALIQFLPLLHTALTGLVLASWVVGLALLWRHRSSYPRLEKPSPSDGETLPALSVLVPACNESATVAQAMRSLLAVEYPDIEIIAVNDRSTDETGDILDCLAAGDPRLRVRHIQELPPGWLGKNHALHTASMEARGEWLLFTDADIVYRADALKAAVGYACRNRADHVVACPHFLGFDFWERLITSYFCLMFSFRTRPWDVARPDRAAYFGFGAFNLVRADAYRCCGGYGAIPMEVIDDAKLGKVLKRHGFRTRIVDARDYLSLRWFVGLKGVLDAYTKNAFASFDFSLIQTVGGVLGLTFTSLYPVLALIIPVPAARWLAGGVMLAMAAGAQAMRRVTDADAWYGLAYPLAAVVLIAMIIRSTWVTLWNRGIVWRGTRYALEELRRGVA